MMLVIVVRFK